MIMRLAGWSKEATTGPTRFYKKCERAVKKESKLNEAETATTASSLSSLSRTIHRHQQSAPVESRARRYLPPPSEIDIFNKSKNLDTSISPVTVETSKQDSPNFFPPPVALATQSVNERAAAQGTQRTTVPISQRIEAVGETANALQRRKTPENAQEFKRKKQELEDATKSAYKVASVLFKSAECKENPMMKFNSADKCAEAVNRMFGIATPQGKQVDLVSGFQLEKALREDRCGKSPPRVGRLG